MYEAVDAWGRPSGYPPIIINLWTSLLKVLGMTAMVIFRRDPQAWGESRWITGGQPVDNGGQPAVGAGLWTHDRLYPWFSTAKSPVDNPSDLRKHGFSTVCTDAMKTMSYLF